MNHKVLICGLGSVGERHLRNLLALGYTDIAVYRVTNREPRGLDGCDTTQIETFRDLDEALKVFEPTVSVVSNPTSLHLSTALTCARAGCHVFIEKPLGDSLQSSEALLRELRMHDRFGMVGYMLRHHPHFQRVKQWLDLGQKGPLGKPVWLRSSWGEYLPGWHPWENDYRESYAARTQLGGGPALTLSHDIDMALWMLGPASRVTAISNRSSPLEIECDHGIDILLSCRGGSSANIHLDYFQSPTERAWKLVGTNGTVVIDYFKSELAYRASGDLDKVISSRLPDGWDRNQMFQAELEYFFTSINAGIQPQPGIEVGAEVVRTALVAQNQ
jgi:predicted dehydrogenase